MSFIRRPFFFIFASRHFKCFHFNGFFKCSGLEKACVLFILSVTSHEEECKFRG